jgi:hypothetical protein
VSKLIIANKKQNKMKTALNRLEGNRDDYFEKVVTDKNSPQFTKEEIADYKKFNEMRSQKKRKCRRIGIAQK